MTEDRVRAAFRQQAQACAALGSPLTAAICARLADLMGTDQGAVAGRVLGWQGDPAGRADSVPLRLCGALHALVLTDADPSLVTMYRARRVEDSVLLAALRDHGATILTWLDSPPQTNEVARSAAIIAGARFAAGHAPLPIRALELGASAGLNLNFHRYDLRPKGALPPAACGDSPQDMSAKARPAVVLEPEWSGAVPGGAIGVAETEGVDVRPLDPVRDGLRLMAYCWADQAARMARLRGALAVARTHPPSVAAGDAGFWLTGRLARPAPGRLTLIYHTVAAQYFPPETRTACETALQRAGARATPDAPVAHLSMEADAEPGGAALRLRLWDGRARAWHLGRADFHGRWIRWQPSPAEAGEPI